MDYQPKIELGQIIQTGGTLLSVMLACVFAYAFLVKDVEFTYRELALVKTNIAKEAELRENEDAELREHFLRRTNEIKQEIKFVEERQRFLLDDMRSDIKYLVRSKSAAETPPKDN